MMAHEKFGQSKDAPPGLIRAGGGGFMLLYCPFEKKHKVASATVRRKKKVRGVAFELHGLQTGSMD